MKVTGNADKSFLTTGFTNWKDATAKFTKHETSDFHKMCVEALSAADVGDMLNREAATERKQNRTYLLKILSSVRFLARQGLPLRGDGDETNSNFHQLLLLRSVEDCPGMSKFLERKQLKYTSHEVQNEFLSIMAQQVLRQVAASLQSSVYYTVMVDETTDAANKEQVVLVFRWVDDDLQVHEDFVGLHETDSTTADALVAIIRDTLLRLNIKLENCRGQCYDGAGVMSGRRSGVAKTLQDEEKRAVFTHCYGHALNLAAGDCIKQCKIIQSAFDTVAEMSKLVKKSPKRDAIFQKLKSELAPDTPGFRVLCPTRWTVRVATLQSIVDNYEVLLSLWEESLASRLDTEMRARILGVQAQMSTFDFLFGVIVGSTILRHTDNLSKTLQQKTLSAAEGQHLASLCTDVLRSLRTDEAFAALYARACQEQQHFEIAEPALRRKRRAPARFEIGRAQGDFPDTPEAHYRQLFFEAVDNVVLAISERFDQPGYRTYRNMQDLITKACRGEPYEDELEYACDFYGDDLPRFQLQTNLPLLRHLFQETAAANVTFHEIVRVLGTLSAAQRLAFSAVWICMKLLLVMPATNATSERPFSALRRVKTYLRTQMTQQRLNHLMVLHVHSDKTDALELLLTAQEFVIGREGRLCMFGDCKQL